MFKEGLILRIVISITKSFLWIHHTSQMPKILTNSQRHLYFIWFIFKQLAIWITFYIIKKNCDLDAFCDIEFFFLGHNLQNNLVFYINFCHKKTCYIRFQSYATKLWTTPNLCRKLFMVPTCNELLANSKTAKQKELRESRTLFRHVQFGGRPEPG